MLPDEGKRKKTQNMNSFLYTIHMLMYFREILEFLTSLLGGGEGLDSAAILNLSPIDPE